MLKSVRPIVKKTVFLGGFIVPGDPTLRLLPEVSPHPPGEPGDGDYRVQAYNFRTILSDPEW